MLDVLQREKITTTLSIQTKEELERIRKSKGFTSINQAIEYAVSNHDLKKQLTMIFDAISELHTSNTRIQGKKDVFGSPYEIPGIKRASDLKVTKYEDPA